MGEGVWLTISRSAADDTDDQSPMLTEIRRLVGEARLWTALPGNGNGSSWVLVEVAQGTASELVERVLDGALNEFEVTRARAVELSECEHDAELILRILGGEQQALVELIQEFAARVEKSMTKRFSDVLDVEEIEGAVNAAACNVWRSASQFNPAAGSLGGWFYKIAEREVYNCIRTHELGDVPLDWDPTEPVRKSWGSTSYHTNGDLISALNKVIDQLPRLQKEVVLADLAAGERADDQRLADRLGSTVNAIRVSRSGARKRIREEIIKLGYDPDDGRLGPFNGPSE